MEKYLTLGEYLGVKYTLGSIEWREFPTGIAKTVLGTTDEFDYWCDMDLSEDALVAMVCEDDWFRVCIIQSTNKNLCS